MTAHRDLGPSLPPLQDERGVLVARRVWPDAGRGAEALVVEATGEDGRVVAARVARGAAVVVDQDRRLPALTRWTGHPTARLIAHRCGKRAVLTLHDEGVCSTEPPAQYVKLARPAATERAAERLESVRRALAQSPQAPSVPEVDEQDLGAGVLVLAALPGPSVRELILQAAASGRMRGAEQAGRRVGVALTAFAAAPAADGIGVHTVHDELAVLKQWVGASLTCSVVRGVFRERLVAAHRSAAARLLALPPAPAVLTHRDLHDGQVLVDPEGLRSGAHQRSTVAFLDLDTVAYADPALDLGNLLAHLDLLAGRRGAGAGTVRAAASFQDGVAQALSAEGHPVTGHDPERVEAFRAATRVRLAAVHAFRPGAPDLVPALLGPSTLAAWTGPNMKVPS